MLPGISDQGESSLVKRPQSLFQELKRRRVFRTAALYIPGAWLLLQFADLAFPVFGIPETALRYVFAAALIGFPLALIFGWVFDITASGIVRTPARANGAAEQADYVVKFSDYLILILLAGVLGAIAHVIVNEPPRQADTSVDAAPERTMIAVLPFANLGLAEDEYFAAGITDEITSRLSSISALGVIASASVQQYADTPMRPDAIAAELGVDYLLFGTVRWAGVLATETRVRISPKLVRARDGTQAWSDVYERRLADVFSIQAEIAKTVVAAVGASLLDAERSPIEDVPTNNLDAYRAYLKSFGPREIDCEWLREQAATLTVAVELDPVFGEAWARLAQARSSLYAHCAEKTQERLSELEMALSNARQLAPKSAATLDVSAQYMMQVEKDYAGSLSLLASSGAVVEQVTSLVNLRGRILRRLGRWDEAIVDFRRGFVLDPRTWAHPMQIASAYMYQRNYSLAIEYFDRSIALHADTPVNYLRKCRTYWLWSGDTVAAREVLQNVSTAARADDQIHWARFWQEVYEGRLEEALRGLEEFKKDWIYAAEEHWPKALLIAEAERLGGNTREAAAAYSDSRRLLESALQESPDEARLHRALGLAYAGLGMRERAIAEGQKSMAIFPLAEHPYFGSTDAMNQARIYTMTGDPEAAIQILDTLLSMPSLVSVPLLELDPRWAPLLDEPGFETLRRKYAKGSR